jgi:hypothetical protein
MNSINRYSRLALAAAVLFALLPAGSLLAQAPPDVITVGTVSGFGTVDVPVYIRDASGSPLGIDQPAGSRIQSYSIKVDYAAPANVSGITFTRAGITAALTPAFESNPAAAGSISLLDSFVEASNLIPFVSNAAAPGNQVAHLLVTIPPAVPPGTVITLTLDPALTQLTNQGGTTQETTGNGSLQLVNGSITVTAAGPTVPTLSHLALALLAISLAIVAVRMVR